MEQTIAPPVAPPEPVESLQEILERGDSLASALSELETKPRGFDVSYKDDLLHMIAKIEELASAIESGVETLDSAQARVWFESLDRVLVTWTKVNEAVDRAVGLAVKGTLAKQFFYLSPIANCANLSERMRLKRLHRRLADRLVVSANVTTDRDPDPAVIADPDLAGVRVVSPSARDAAPDRHLLHTPGAVEDLEHFEGCLARLVRNDELDRNEALVDIIRRHQHLLVARMLENTAADLNDSLEVVARHAELVLLEDYFYSARRMKLSHLLASFERGPTARLFRESLSLFHGQELDAGDALAPFEVRGREALETALRIMLVHPEGTYRRHAVNALEPWQIWPVTSYPQVPMATIDEVSIRIMSDDVSDDYRRVFFDCTYGRLMKAETEAEVRDAREVVNRYFSLDFFLEDHYFLRLQRLNERVELLEKRFGIENPLFEESLRSFLREKDRTGSRKTRLPKSFVEIPLTVQRKLAREGHYLSLFIRHPRPKIALETLRFLDTSAKVEKVLRLRSTNGHVVREIAKREELLTTYNARLALLGNPHVPVELSLKHVASMRADDLRRLAASRDIHPELARCLKARFRRPSA